MDPHKKENVPLAQTLRKRMTPEERRMWYDFLKDYPIRFKRQVAIGPYIVDFYCPTVKLVIELDGRQHYTEEGRKNDAERTAYLKENCGIHVIRFKNYQIRDRFSSVCEQIELTVNTYAKPE
ncbi:MAG: endonuclease domain-containing protein [Clostridia bacterium]|nr:endonuclease domain-containing protein [Clostridia bacterium]